MSQLPPHHKNGKNTPVSHPLQDEPDDCRPQGNYDHPFDVWDTADRARFVDAVNWALRERDLPSDEQEQRTIRLEVDGDYEYVQAVVERLCQFLNVTWVSAEPDHGRGRGVNWFVVVEWPELLPETDAGKPLTRAQWNALERLYKQHAIHPAESARWTTLESLISRKPALASLRKDDGGSAVEITEAGAAYYEIHKETYLRRYWNSDALSPRDNGF